jgi:type I restriction enzyme M protein
VLFRGGVEERIRTKLLTDRRIDTVIGLPANLFYSAGIPVCILVLKKCKKPDDVLFINAAEHFEKGKRQNRLTDEQIQKIIETYQFRREEKRYSKRVSMERIAEEGYNLNISRYISTAVQEAEIDLAATHDELVQIEQQIQEGNSQAQRVSQGVGAWIASRRVGGLPVASQPIKQPNIYDTGKS